jgi:hypothetical protein
MDGTKPTIGKGFWENGRNLVDIYRGCHDPAYDQAIGKIMELRDSFPNGLLDRLMKHDTYSTHDLF